MIRVLHIGLTDKSGGIENLLKNLIMHIDRTKVVFDFVSEYDNPAYQMLFEDLGCKIHCITKSKYVFSYTKDMYNIIKDYDIVHIHKNSNINAIALLLCSIHKNKKIIVHSHNAGISDTNKKFMFIHHMNRFIMKFLQFKRVACGIDAGKWLFGPDLEYEVFHNPIDIETMHYDTKLRKKMKEAYIDQFVIGHIGRFCEQKNQLYLIEIFKRILEFDRNSRLIFLGDGDQLSMCKEKVKEYKLEKYVEFKGTVDHVERYLQLFDVFVLPSLYEGLPIVGIEAQATGLPCVFSNNVTKETEVTNLITWFDLNDSIDSTVMKILNAKSINRIDKSEEIKNSGFDIETALHQLYQIYGVNL